MTAATMAAQAQILLFSKTEGFRHASIVDGVSMVASLAADAGLSLVATPFSKRRTAFRSRTILWSASTGDSPS